MAVFTATTNPEESVRERENQKRVRALAVECMVLLRNDKETLPLQKSGKVALFGNGAINTVKGGTGSGDVYVRRSVNIYDGLTEEGFTVTTKTWFEKQDKVVEEEHQAFIERVTEECKKTGKDVTLTLALNPFNASAVALIDDADVAESDTDTAVYVIARNSGEGKDRSNVPGDYQISAEDEANIRFIASHYKKSIVLLNTGGVLDSKVLRAEDGPDAVVYIGQLGNIGGLAVADMLKGTAYPSGRLTDTWAENYEDYASAATFSHNDDDITDEYYTEGIFTGYRYFDTFNITPGYEFGYGLSYTSFSVVPGNLTVEKDKIGFEVTVKNTGEKKGKDVVQVYISAPEGEIDKPYQELKAFGKTRELEPGEEETLSFCIDAASLASYSEEKAAWVLEKGTYLLRVGESSRKTCVFGKVVLDETVVTKQLKNLFADADKKEADLSSKGAVRYSYPEEAAQIEKAECAVLKAADIETETACYSELPEAPENRYPDVKIQMTDVLSGKYTVADLVSQLTVDERICLLVGNFDENTDPNDLSAVLGHASLHLPGSAGETTEFVKGRDIRTMELCDGPAGLRLTPTFLGKEDGTFLSLGTIYESERTDIDRTGYTQYYQYCTAIPIAAILASSWNMDLLETCGNIVGSEMEEFGATLWLAPGMNNHRNPLCGRNFEYYSEDPLLAGKCAAADTRGVQKHKGIGTTIKHFAANNQEDNRMFTNSHVSERALREIYLRSFEITVKEAQPMAMMTSYNLINGTHAANYKEMIQSAARDEWGFRGIVMTDWLTTSPLSKGLSFETSLKYDEASPVGCVIAGNDLIEPGTKDDIRLIKEAYERGEVSLGEISICAERILSLMLKTHLYEGAEPYNDKVPGRNVTFTCR
ncbi:MAG: glycoside hydrolase family 3 C-terminal domain-containing protein [Lachnospiraceae bacterium]|nr:glycoside hydrolase family 3 C-terminal domain-containing protein [Lachnospiraceae bacterium]